MTRRVLAGLLVAAAALVTCDQASARVRRCADDCPPPACAPCPPKKCCYEPCIRYQSRGCVRNCCADSCAPPQKLVLKVTDPCCCDCCVDVPVCIPGCCQGEPCVTTRCGFRGRTITTYEWCCGFRVRLTTSRCGDITVTYLAR